MYEIELKFLLDELPAATADVEPTRIDQGYLAVTDDLEVRVRARASHHQLTVEGGRGEVRAYRRSSPTNCGRSPRPGGSASSDGYYRQNLNLNLNLNHKLRFRLRLTASRPGLRVC